MKNSLFRILVVEDDFLVRREIKRIVMSLGHDVIGEAANGEAAIEKTLELKPDIILMDIEMGVMGGIEAASHIQQQCSTPIVFLTAYETPDFVEMVSMVGGSAYLTKPPEAADIDRAVIIAMARHQDVQKLRELNEQLEKQKEELQAALDDVKMLRDILPICCHCKKIRDDEGYWEQVESYIQKHTLTRFTHGICPECMKDHHNIQMPEK